MGSMWDMVYTSAKSSFFDRDLIGTVYISKSGLPQWRIGLDEFTANFTVRVLVCNYEMSKGVMTLAFSIHPQHVFREKPVRVKRGCELLPCYILCL